MSYVSPAPHAISLIDASAVRHAAEMAASTAAALMGCLGVAAVLWAIVAAPGVLG